MAGAPATQRYQWLLVGLLTANFGIVYFDRMALNYLMPSVQPELGLSNTAVGTLASALSLSWALAGLLIGRVSDAIGRRKPLLILAAVIFSGASFLSGIATSFAMLLAARLLMGAAEGGVMPISQALVAAEVQPERRGLAMGVTQNFGANLLGNFLGPIVIVAFAQMYGWRQTFYLAALPGFIVAVLMWLLIREPPAAPSAAASSNEAKSGGAFASIGAVIGERNVILCVLMSILLVAFAVVFGAFVPLYLVSVKHMAPTTMSWLMSMFGLTSMAFAFLVPGSSDVLGRRPVVIAMTAIGALLPLCILFIDGPVWPLFVFFGLGAAASGVFPIVMATIPSESVSPGYLATVMGLTMGLGEIVGGVFSPAAAGWAADLYGLRATLWILVGLIAVATLLACGLKETSPARVRSAARLST
jgi:ACS family hexuronate transporter-like MFS transporter